MVATKVKNKMSILFIDIYLMKPNVHNEGRAPLLRTSLSIVGLEITILDPSILSLEGSCTFPLVGQS